MVGAQDASLVDADGVDDVGDVGDDGVDVGVVGDDGVHDGVEVDDVGDDSVMRMAMCATTRATTRASTAFTKGAWGGACASDVCFGRSVA